MTVHVIGAGLAGLSAAVELTACGQHVIVHEAARQAGGRCRSYFDASLGLTIDNGNHFVAAGNHAVAAYLARIGASDRLAGEDEARFDFVDVRDGARWTLRPNAGRLPWWVFDKGRRVPGTRVGEYLKLAALLQKHLGKTVGEVIPAHGPLWDKLLDTFFRSALNTAPELGSATLAGAIVRETLAAGGDACRPRYASPTLAAAFVDPALTWLMANGAEVRLGSRVRAIEREGKDERDAGRVTALRFVDETVALGPSDAVIVATPPWIAAELLPETTVPDEYHAIVNAHFAVAPPPGVPAILAIIGGTAEWLVAHPDRISVTVSAADILAKESRADIATKLWADITAAYGITAPMSSAMPPFQVIKEARATFAATPAQDARRPAAATETARLFLAGDWTQTGLPATIEGALRSGVLAAGLAVRHG